MSDVPPDNREKSDGTSKEKSGRFVKSQGESNGQRNRTNNQNLE